MMFTPSQQVALAVIPKLTGFLSILGSSWIIVEVLTQQTKRENVYNRLLCAMSIVDVSVSIWFFASSWPIPEGTEGVAWTVGSKRTCVIQGFFIQMGATPPIYNCCLAVYYMMVVKFGVTEPILRRTVEPATHFLALSFGFGTATSGVFLDLYNDANLWCWIAPYPVGCEDSRTYGETTCIRGDNAWIYRWAFYFAPLWLIIIFVTMIMVSVYRTVRRRELDAMDDDEHANKRRSSVIKNVPASVASSRSFDGNGSHTKRRPSLVMPRAMADSLNSSKMFRLNEADANHVLKTIETFTSAKHQNIEMNHFGSRSVFQQSLYYTMAFYVTYTFATIDRIVQWVTGDTYFAIILLHSIFTPMQGFFNLLIYRYAYCFRLKQRHPHISGWDLMRYAWRWSFLGPPPYKRDSRNKLGTSGEVEARHSTKRLSTTRFSAIDESEEKDRVPSNVEDKSDEGSIMTDNVGAVHLLGDELDEIEKNLMDDMVADLLMTYSEFPNVMAEATVMVTTQYPTMIGQDSYTGTATTNFSRPSPSMTTEPQSFPTMINESDEE